MSNFVIISAFLLICLIVFLKWNRKPNTNQLPGPTLLPYIGCVYDLPLKFTWLKLKKWADVYGPIYRTKIMGNTFIVISDETIIEELLVNRARINSDRPAFPSVVDSKSTHGSMEYLPVMGRNSKVFTTLKP
jgi:hypothetical protein